MEIFRCPNNFRASIKTKKHEKIIEWFRNGLNVIIVLFKDKPVWLVQTSAKKAQNFDFFIWMTRSCSPRLAHKLMDYLCAASFSYDMGVKFIFGLHNPNCLSCQLFLAICLLAIRAALRWKNFFPFIKTRLTIFKCVCWFFGMCEQQFTWKRLIQIKGAARLRWNLIKI